MQWAMNSGQFAAAVMLRAVKVLVGVEQFVCHPERSEGPYHG
jgi:hypothetical protein